jgi:hypothetical protein
MELVALGVGLIVVGVLAGAALSAVRRQRRRGPAIDPFAVGEPWRHFVQDALQARSRFARAAAAVRSGPLAEQLADVARRLDRAVEECWLVARRGHQLDDARQQLQGPKIRARLAALPDDDPTAPALRQQLAAIDRLATASADTRDRLRVLTAQLDQAAAHGIEVAATTGAPVPLATLDRNIESVTLELQALRLALEELEPS